MEFHQLLFPFVFLPAAYGIFRLTPQRFRKTALLTLSLLFIAWGSLTDLYFVLLSAAFNYLSGLQIDRLRKEQKDRQARLTLISAVAADLLLLGYFKYYGFAVREIGALFRAPVPVRTAAAPAGVSFFTFSELSYLSDVYRGRTEGPGKPLDYGLFISFFPKFSSGPILQWNGMVRQAEAPAVSLQNTESGLRMFLVGLCKKVLIADTLRLIFDPISAMPAKDLSLLTAWTGALSYTFLLYFDFSGYSDMAAGLGRVFGFTLPVNFRYPYQSESVADFWRRWHASLGAWFRDYVYIPLGGSREGTKKTIRNLMTVWLLTGIWHGANWTFLLWGVWHGLLIVLEKFVLKDLLPKLPSPLRKTLTFLAVTAGWVLFFSPDIGSAFRFLGRMTAVGSFADTAALYYLKSALPLLVLAALGSTDLIRRAAQRVEAARRRWFFPAQLILFAIGLLLCVAAMVGSTNTSFLYSQF